MFPGIPAGTTAAAPAAILAVVAVAGSAAAAAATPNTIRRNVIGTTSGVREADCVVEVRRRRRRHVAVEGIDVAPILRAPLRVFERVGPVRARRLELPVVFGAFAEAVVRWVSVLHPLEDVRQVGPRRERERDLTAARELDRLPSLDDTMRRGEHHFVLERVIVPQRERDLTADVEGVADVAARIPNGVGVVVDVTRAALAAAVRHDGEGVGQNILREHIGIRQVRGAVDAELRWRRESLVHDRRVHIDARAIDWGGDIGRGDGGGGGAGGNDGSGGGAGGWCRRRRRRRTAAATAASAAPAAAQAAAAAAERLRRIRRTGWPRRTPHTSTRCAQARSSPIASTARCTCSGRRSTTFASTTAGWQAGRRERPPCLSPSSCKTVALQSRAPCTPTGRSAAGTGSRSPRARTRSRPRR